MSSSEYKKRRGWRNPLRFFIIAHLEEQLYGARHLVDHR